ncbi:MAG: hypothetical protein J6N22_07230, partial [Schwartzia sp.]|nr:hypothetical protein [Schwartzia sp. (in: firmicutes)]
NIIGDEKLGMHAAEEAAEFVTQQAAGEIDIIFGTVCNPAMAGRVKAMLVVTGFDADDQKV